MDEQDYVEAYEKEYPTLTQRLEEFLHSDEFRETFVKGMRDLLEEQVKRERDMREWQQWRWRNPQWPLPNPPWTITYTGIEMGKAI